MIGTRLLPSRDSCSSGKRRGAPKGTGSGVEDAADGGGDALGGGQGVVADLAAGGGHGGGADPCHGRPERFGTPLRQRRHDFRTESTTGPLSSGRSERRSITSTWRPSLASASAARIPARTIEPIATSVTSSPVRATRA